MRIGPTPIFRSVLEAQARRTHHRVVLRKAPSFHEKLCAEHRICDAIRPDGHASPVYHWETKLGGKTIAVETGISVAEVLQGPCAAEKIDWDSLPDHFVIKPTFASADDGVMVLRQLDDGFKDLITGTLLTEFDVRRAAPNTRSVLVEEILGDGERTPDDFRFFSFNGRVELINQTRRSDGGARKWRDKWYDAAWNDVGNPQYDGAADSSLEPPTNPGQLLEAARALSLAAVAPFVRVDLYELDGEPVFGELTPRPGQHHRFKLHWDERLGTSWERAEVELAGRWSRPGAGGTNIPALG